MNRKHAKRLPTPLIPSRSSGIRYSRRPKRGLETFRSDEKEFSSIFEHSINGIAIHDIVRDATGKPIDYVFTKINPAFEKITGFKAKDLIGKRASRVIPGIEQTRFLDLYGKAVESGHPILFEEYAAPIQRHFEVIAFSPFKGKFYVIFSDITAQKKRIESELRRSEQKDAQIFEASPASFAISRLSDGLFYDVNKAFERTLKYRREEVVGRTSSELGIWNDLKDRERIVQRLLREKSIYDEEIQFRTKDRELRIILYSAEKMKLAGQPALLSLFVDITEQKKTEQQLRESEKKYRQIIDTANEGILTLNKDFIINFANAHMATMLGYSVQELLGTPMSSYLFKEDLPDQRKHTEARRNGLSETYERRFRKKSGQALWAIISATPIMDEQRNFLGSFAMITDITERKRAEEGLRQSEEKFSKTFQLSPSLLFISRLQDGTILDANESFIKTWARTRDEIIGRTTLPGAVNIWMNSNDRRIFVENLIDQGEVEGYEVTSPVRDGSLHIFSMSAKTIKIKNEDCIIGNIRDITTSKQEQEALLAAKEFAESANRIKTEFLDIAAHELRTPVTPIALLTQVAKKQLARGVPVPTSFFDQIERQVFRLTSLIDDLLDASRLERGKFTLHRVSTDLTPIIHECVENFKMSAPKRTFRFDPPDQKMPVHADPIRILQVIGNFLDNAVKYTPENAPIEIEIKLQADFIRVSVTDHGKGISIEDQAKIFDQFYRANSPTEAGTQGLGLGLYICRRIMELHGGRIGVKSQLQKGSTFFFELPRREH